MHKLDADFTITKFLYYCENCFVPNVLESWLQGHLSILKDWCHESVFNVLTEPLKQAEKQKCYWDNKILDISEVEVFFYLF